MTNIQLRRLKLDIHHNKYSLVIVRLLDVTQSTFVNCFQSFENTKDFNYESWICPVIKSTIEDQFNDFFSINLNATNLPISSLLLVIEFYKINTGFKDANPTLTGFGFLPLFYQNEKSITPSNNGEITLYDSSKIMKKATKKLLN